MYEISDKDGNVIVIHEDEAISDRSVKFLSKDYLISDIANFFNVTDDCINKIINK